MDVNAFEQELMRRSPLAASVSEISDFIFDDRLLSSIWEGHRGRCYQDVLKFEDFLRLMRDALVRHGGSAHQLFVELERDGAEPVDESNFYRKLARTPVELSRALLRECTGRLAGLVPAGAATGPELPGCFDGFEVIVGDGKKIRNAAKRLKPTRGYSGKLIGAKALVAMDVRGGMAVAMSDSLDGMANDVPLVPALMEQLRQTIAGPILSVWDRQFDDVRTLGRLSSRGGDAFLVRLKQRNHTYAVESGVQGVDAHGRAVRDEVGLLGKGEGGKGEGAMRVRRITLTRGDGEEDVVLLSNLLDREAFAAADLLELYRRRWGIEIYQSWCLHCDRFYESALRGLGRVRSGSAGRQCQLRGQVRSRRRRSSSSASAQRTHRPPAPCNCRALTQPRPIQLYNVGCGSVSSRARSLNHHSPSPRLCRDGRVVTRPRRYRLSRTMPGVKLSRRLGGRQPSALSVPAICRDVGFASRSSRMRWDRAG